MPLSLKISFLMFQLLVREITKQCGSRTQVCPQCDRTYKPEVITHSNNLPLKHDSLLQHPGTHVKSATLCLSETLT